VQSIKYWNYFAQNISLNIHSLDVAFSVKAHWCKARY